MSHYFAIITQAWQLNTICHCYDDDDDDDGDNFNKH